ncbi:hypothetical protein EYC08_18535 [Tabrizicola sp. WMC-M-20]|nr:hypothetical protein EYC08_18535 [Tabrizicola sp. WMC-M-20]
MSGFLPSTFQSWRGFVLTLFQSAWEWISANRGFILAAIKVLGVLALIVVGIGIVLTFVGGAIAFGFPLAAAVLIAVFCFFAIAWIPFAPIVFLFGLFGYRRSILTHRTRNALIVTCIAIFIGDMFSVELTNSPLFNVLNLPESAYAGYAAVLVISSALLYTRFVYLDGLATLLGSTSSNMISRPIRNVLIFPSFAVISVLVDFLVPATFTAIVVDRHGCEGIQLVSQFAAGIEREYNVTDNWDGFVGSISEMQIWQESSERLRSFAQSAYAKFPILVNLQERVAEYGATLPQWSLCDQDV